MDGKWIVRKVIELIMPSLSNWRYNKVIRQKIHKEEGLDTPSATVPLAKISKEKLEQLYDRDINAKEKLEDKAKTNVIGITVSVTLIIGAYSLLQSIFKNHGLGTVYWIAFSLFVVAVIYMLAAGIHAIHMLTAENTIHTESFEIDDELYKRDLDRKIGLNRARNTIRNNYVFTSYECIRNSLLCLFVVMVIAIVPVQKDSHTHESSWQGSYFLSADAMRTIHNGIDSSVITAYIEDQPQKEGTVAVVDEKDKIFIKYSIDGENGIIYMIEPLMD